MVRAKLNSPMRTYMRFIRTDAGMPDAKITTNIGFRGRNLVFNIGNKYVYKFSIRHKNTGIEQRELQITDAFRKISPIYIPKMKIIKCRGELVRRYEYIAGPRLPELTDAEFNAHYMELARTIAEFIFTIAISDPDNIKSYKSNPTATPGYMFGWWHGDICDNFMINRKTWQPTAFIDWEDAAFNNFAHIFDNQKTPRQRLFMGAVRTEYDRIWAEHTIK